MAFNIYIIPIYQLFLQNYYTANFINKQLQIRLLKSGTLTASYQLKRKTTEK